MPDSRVHTRHLVWVSDADVKLTPSMQSEIIYETFLLIHRLDVESNLHRQVVSSNKYVLPAQHSTLPS